MKLHHFSRTVLAIAAILASSAHAGEATLAPVTVGTAPGGTMAGGLTGTWYQVSSDLRFSDSPYAEPGSSSPAPIKDYTWGTGIWATSDIASMASGGVPLVATAQTVGPVSYANNIYNNTVQSGAYGTWGADYVRPLTPFQTTNACTSGASGCDAETNYAATFSGYLYVSQAGNYDFGVFSDDGFTFQLTGADGQLDMGLPTLAGSTGRVSYSLQDFNSLSSIHLSQGYYGISLAYFNRMEAGVVDLGWTGPATASTWTTIGNQVLVPTAPVPEPETYAMLLLGMLVVGRTAFRRRRRAAAAAAA